MSHRSTSDRVRRCAGVLFLSALVVATIPSAVRAQDGTTPYDLARARAGEPTWSPLIRLRAAESRFTHDSASQRHTWLQLLAQAEATFGNHQRAFEAWDRLRTPPAADVELVRQRFTRARQLSILDTLLTMADTARVIMINERHHAASDRVLTLQLLRELRGKGFRYFAAEAMSETMSETSSPATRNYEVDGDAYTSEPVFAELLREAKRLGYVLVPYEAVGRQFDEPDSLTPQQRRDYAQARNLAAATVLRDSQAKVLVHAGFDHVRERATAQWSPMAAYFTALTGIDPVTVDQTSGTERSAPAFAHPVHRALSGQLPTHAVSFVDATGVVIGATERMVDFVAFRAASPLIDARPAFLLMDGARQPARIAVPECESQHCVLTAHHTHEPDSAVVLDRAEVERGTRVTLFLPRTPVRLTLYSASGTRLRQWAFRAE